MAEFLEDEEDRAHRERWEKKIREMKRQKKKQQQRMRMLGAGIICLILFVLIIGIVSGVKRSKNKDNTTKLAKSRESVTKDSQSDEINSEEDPAKDSNTEAEPEELEASSVNGKIYEAKKTSTTTTLGGDVISNYGILIDVDSDSIVAQKNGNTRINPASMTKILTLLVAAEHIDDLDKPFTISHEIIDFCFANDCSNAGFEEGETVTLRDCMYGTILPSGAEAALALATYVSGSQEEFVKLMNQKVEELGLSDTSHFTNCMGIYGSDHYSTVYDIAMIMRAAMDNPTCVDVLSAHTYNTSITDDHPEGMILSNWFLRRIEDKDCGGEVIGAKTGYVVESGSCAASFAKGNNGKNYVCVTADSTSSWRCIYDHVDIYKRFIEQ